MSTCLSRSGAARTARSVAGLLLGLACTTCDASTALRPAEMRDIVMAWEGDTLLVAGTTRPAVIRVRIDGEPYAAARVRLSSSDPDLLTVGPDGTTLHARRLGTVVLTAELQDAVLPRNAPRLETTLVVTPGAIRVAASADTLRSLGDTARLTATVVDADGQAIGGMPVQWSAADTSVASVDASGLVTAVGNGTVAIEARLGATSATAAIVVRQRLAAFAFSAPAVVLDALGMDTLVTLRALDARGWPLDALAPPVTWTMADPAIATVSGGRVTAVAPGATWLRAAAGTCRDSIPATVQQIAARVVVETPAPVALQSIGESATLTARAYDRRANEIEAGVPSWRSLNPRTVYVEAQTGIATGLATGSAGVVATLDGASDTVVVDVANLPARVILEPEAATLTSVGDTLQLRWSVRNARGNEIEGVSPSFASADPAIAQLGPSGQVIAVSTGTVRVVASTAGGPADTSLVTVVDAVAHVEIAADLVTMASVGDSAMPPASIRNARSAQLPRSAAVWSTDDGGVARVTAAGIVIASGEGETLVRATSPHYPDRRDSVRVVVTNAPTAVVIEREADMLTAVGMARAYAAEVRNARGALLSTPVQWRTLDAAVASVSTTGLVTATGAGTARIVAAAGAASDTLVVVVRDDVVAVEMSPDAATLTSIGDVLRPTVTTRNALGGIVAAPVLTWSVSDTTVASLRPDGTLVATAVGTARVVVTSGAASDTLALTVRNDAVHLDILRPGVAIPAIGDSATLAVVALNARGDTLSLANVTWSIDDPVVARVSAMGTVTARGIGTTWVRASGGSASDSTLIVVTNEPGAIAMRLAASGAEATLDTMTAAGQALDYDVSVMNLLGLPIADAVVTWRSSDAAVASVSPAGVATALGFGNAWIVAAAGQVADSVLLVVTEPRRLYVDNGVVTPARFGTLARPFATIQDAVDAAGVDDTVIVRRGNSYSEAVTLGRRVTLLGDSAAFIAGGRDPLLLPLLRHDLGPAGITTSTPGASYTIRYLGIQHSVDGEAIAARDVDNLVVTDVFVNPIPGFRTGRGILVDRPAGAVHVARTQVDSVYAFGIRIRDAAAARLEDVTVRAVAARNAEAGAGIELLGGTGVVERATVRRTAGPQVLFSRTSGASLLASSLAGEQQLARLDSVRGVTTVAGSTFDLRRQPGEAPPVRGGAFADPSGLEILGAAGVLVDGNVFMDLGGQASLMDGVRLAGVRVGTSGAPYGALLSRNQFRGGRAAVRSAGSTWSMTTSRVDSAAYGILLADADTVTLVRDTIANARVAAVRSSGAAARVELTESRITGDQRALLVTSAARVTVRHSSIAGTAFSGIAQPMAGAVDISATTAEVANTSIVGMRGWAGLVLRSGNARADSNVVTRNLVGIRLGAASLPSLTANAVFDNDTLPASQPRAGRGVVNDGAPRLIGANWWGAPEGPASDAPLAPPARGDSIIGGITAGVLAAPITTHQGGMTFGAFRKFAGDGQAGTVGMPLANPLVIRVVDDAGRPLAGFTALFRVPRTSGDFVGGVRSGNENVVTVLTDANGLAEARYVPAVAGPATITSTVDRGSITFAVTVP